MPTIPVYICEDHHDALPFYWALARASKRLGSSSFDSLVHFDSHPDLSVPDHHGTTRDWSSLSTLYYDILESSDGCIAQWLLPLLYQGIFRECVWVRRAEHCHQMQAIEGSVDQVNSEQLRFHCGTSSITGRAAVSLHRAYYLDEGCCCSERDLLPDTCREVHVRLSTIDDLLSSETDAGTKQAEEAAGWCLDICLDYFYTLNPFLAPLKALIQTDCLAEKAAGLEAKAVLDTIVSSFRDLEYRRENGQNDGALRASRRDEAVALLSQILADPREEDANALAALYSPLDQTVGPDQSLAGRSRRFIQTLAALSEETRGCAKEAAFCLLLPHFPSTLKSGGVRDAGSVDAIIESMFAALSRRPAPRGVSIAKSVNDGYTPENTADGTDLDSHLHPSADELLSKVLALIDRLAAHWGCAIELTDVSGLTSLDDAEADAYTTCYTLFLSDEARGAVRFREAGEHEGCETECAALSKRAKAGET